MDRNTNQLVAMNRVKFDMHAEQEIRMLNIAANLSDVPWLRIHPIVLAFPWDIVVLAARCRCVWLRTLV